MTVNVQYETEPERADENQALVEKVFAALGERRPAGLRYASYRLADGVRFVHVASIETDDGTNPLTDTPEFRQFLEGTGSGAPCRRPPRRPPWSGSTRARGG